MQLIRGYKEIWKRKISFADRLLFATMLLIISGIYFFINFINKEIPFSEYKWSSLAIITLILLIICTNIPGSWFIKCWLMISSTIGKIIFGILLFLVYFLLISPIFILRNLFGKSQNKTASNWEEPMINKDYLNMG